MLRSVNERMTDRQTDRQTETQTDRQTEKETQTDRDGETDTKTQTNRETDTDKDSDRETGQTDRDKDREGGINCVFESLERGEADRQTDRQVFSFKREWCCRIYLRGVIRGKKGYLISWCFEPSQPHESKERLTCFNSSEPTDKVPGFLSSRSSYVFLCTS